VGSFALCELSRVFHLAASFTSVTDRFLAEIGPITSGQVPKDLDMKYENLFGGLKHIQIKVCCDWYLILRLKDLKFPGLASRGF
jgi:hypothetical protein